MEEEEGGMEAGEDEVCMLRGSAMRAVWCAVWERSSQRPPKPILNVGAWPRSKRIQIRIVVRPSAVDGVQIEGGCARVDRLLQRRRHPQPGG
jgi:hypothetical protein